MGQGVTVKVSGTQKYASDCKMYAILKGLSEKYDILLQEINDRNTIRGGTTLGPMIGSHLPMAGCDLAHRCLRCIQPERRWLWRIMLVCVS